MNEKLPKTVLEENKLALEETMLSWNDLVESSSIDRTTKDKLRSVIRDAGLVIGQSGMGAQMDKIGEHLSAIKFIFESTHGDNHDEIDALVSELDTDIVTLHRKLLDKNINSSEMGQ